MTHSFGDVVLVPFPFTDQSGAKKRPAVIVSSSGYNAHRRDLVIMAITSQVHTQLGFGEALVADWQTAGLIKPSVLMGGQGAGGQVLFFAFCQLDSRPWQDPFVWSSQVRCTTLRLEVTGGRTSIARTGTDGCSSMSSVACTDASTGRCTPTA